MDSGFYAACTGLAAKTRQLESAAHNLANTGTTAFKQQQLAFRSLVSRSEPELSKLNYAVNEYGVAASPVTDVSSGTIERTGNELDLAVEGPAFLAIQTRAGIAYTRNGHLQVSVTGQLTTATGDAVIGDQGPISIPPGAKISISPDGTISAAGALVGKLKLSAFNEGTSFNEVSPGVYLADRPPFVAKTSYVRQGALEMSNVNGVEAAVGLIAIQRHAEMLQRALSLFHSEFNRIAATDLSRV